MGYVVFTEDLPYVGNLDPVDKNFLLGQKFIEIKSGIIYSKFVGEIITPKTSFFSLPKNIEDIDLISSIKKLLDKYKRKGGNLLYNTTFSISNNNQYISDSYFFKRLKSFFLDFVTYEFISPLETIKIHSNEPLPGRIDIIQTNINRKIYGDGVTYEVVDKKNSEDWILDDIYYHTMEELANSVGTPSEKYEIEKMKEYLVEEAGFSINSLNQNMTDEEIINKIRKCNVDIIHTPIKNTLIEYYSRRKLGSSQFRVNVFYTKDFEYVWENIIQETLEHNPDVFGRDFLNRFKNTRTSDLWAPSSQRKEIINKNKISNWTQSQKNQDYVTYEFQDKEPDLFSCGKSAYTDGLIGDSLKFVGDGKYYNKIRSDFSKEYLDYNDCMNNLYPMVVFIPGNKTFIPPGRDGYLRQNISGPDENKKELIIMVISIKEIIDDYLYGTKKVLEDVHRFIMKRSIRIDSQRKGYSNK
jgi:hypothetical protein